MNAMEKAAWTEMLVCIAAAIAVSLLVPWLGHRAAGAFGLLGLLPVSYIFLRQRGSRVVIDERDREIERRSTTIGVNSAGMTVFTVLIAITMWSSYSHADSVPTRFLSWLLWIQFAICYGTRGLAAVLMYRRQHAA